MSAPRYIRDQWEADPQPRIKRGDYVIATKYRDGDPGDHFCIGFYACSYEHYGTPRHMVVDNRGMPFRANGFRRVARVGAKRGEWMVRNLALIYGMRDRYSVWHWYHAPWCELADKGS